MAEVINAPSTASEPTMEEILASIRRIIAEDPPPPAAPNAESASEEAPPEEVYELTQMVQDDGTIVNLKDAPEETAPLEMSTQDDVSFANEAMPEMVAPEPQPEAPVKMESPQPMETLVSSTAASLAAASMSSLMNTVQIERLASSPAKMTMLGNGARTLEDMVIELMRPMLKGWLDENLPAIVERMVQKEIERITRLS